MATTFKAKASRSCWKQHTCLTCGSAYKYRFTRSVDGTASTAVAAQENAQKALTTALETTVDIRPCPYCGLVQPEMVGQVRGEKHGCMIGMSLLLIVVVWMMYGFGWAHFRTISYVALGIGFFIAAKHMSAALHNPNFNLFSNKTKVATDVEKGTTVLVEQGNDPGLDSLPTSVSPTMKVAFMLLLASLALFPAAEIFRVASRWTYNELCDPPVCGPGDRVRIYEGGSISSIKGMWNSKSVIVVKNAAELGVAPGAFVPVPRTDFSGGALSWKTSERHDSADVYAEVVVPNAQQLTGRTVDLGITLNVTTPQYKNSNMYTVQGQAFAMNPSLVISASGSGGLYTTVWWTGIVGGLVLQLLAGFVLSIHSDKLKKGLPTQLLAID